MWHRATLLAWHGPDRVLLLGTAGVPHGTGHCKHHPTSHRNLGLGRWAAPCPLNILSLGSLVPRHSTAKQAAAAIMQEAERKQQLIAPKMCLGRAGDCPVQGRQSYAQAEVAAATHPSAGFTALSKLEAVLLIKSSRAGLWGFIGSKMNL